jgi:TRAP-type C4-dicarboxylate transport system permease small subunit
MITRAIDMLYRLLQVLVTLLMAVLIVPVALQIVSRFTEVIPRYIWTEEMARFCFIWIIMLGSMLAVRDDTHFDLEVLPAPKTPHGRAFARLIRHAAMLLVALTFVWFGRCGVCALPRGEDRPGSADLARAFR